MCCSALVSCRVDVFHFFHIKEEGLLLQILLKGYSFFLFYPISHFLCDAWSQPKFSLHGVFKFSDRCFERYTLTKVCFLKFSLFELSSNESAA